MASVTLDVAGVFPDSTSLSIFDADSQSSQSSVPLGTPITTATVSGGEVTVTGVTEDESYVAIGLVGDDYRRYGFTVNELAPAPMVGGIEIAQQSALTAEASTRAAADTALEAADTTLDAKIDAKIAVIGEVFECDTSGATAEGANINTAIENVASQGGGNFLLPATAYNTGYIKIEELIDIPQAVNFRGQGQRETRLLCSDASAGLKFNRSFGGSPVNSRGGRCGDFHIDGNNLATTVMDISNAVNRSFSDFRFSRPGANGIGFLAAGTQNCNISNFDSEATRATANTTGIKVTDSAGSVRFSKFSMNEYSYCSIHVTQDNVASNGYPEPRYCTFDDGIVERGDTDTAAGIRIHSGRDLWFSRMNLALGVGDTQDTDYPLIEVNDSGNGGTRQVYFDRGGCGGNTSPAKHSIAFDIQAGAADYFTRITNWQFGNNTIGVRAASGQTVEVDAYNNTSATTMFSGSGTINRRAMGATSYSTS